MSLQKSIVRTLKTGEKTGKPTLEPHNYINRGPLANINNQIINKFIQSRFIYTVI